MKPNGVGLSQLLTELGDHEGQWEAQPKRGFLEPEKVWGRLFAGSRYPEKKNLQASLKAGWSRGWQLLKAAVESGAFPSGLITATHDPGQLKALSAKYLRGSEPPTEAALFTLSTSWCGRGRGGGLSFHRKWTN